MKPGGAGRMSGEAGALRECEVNTLMTPVAPPPSRCAALGWVESELVGLPGMALSLDAMGRLRFVVCAAGWLHSMVLHGRTGCPMQIAVCVLCTGANVFLTSDGHVKLGDFGCSVKLKNAVTMPGEFSSLVGTTGQ